MISIDYSGFYDAPLAFRAWFNGSWFYFWRGYFDEELDEYPIIYEVFSVEAESSDVFIMSWDIESFESKKYVGKIAMNEVLFDPTKREKISVATFNLIE